MNKVVIFHDSDLDGFSAAVIIADMEYKLNNTCASYAIKRSKGIVPEAFATADCITSVYILDYRPSKEELAAIDKTYPNAQFKYIIDHHQIGNLREYLPCDWHLVHPYSFDGNTEYNFGNQSAAYMAAVVHLTYTRPEELSFIWNNNIMGFASDMGVVEAISDRDCGRHRLVDSMSISSGLMVGESWKSYENLRQHIFSEPGVFRKSDDPHILEVKAKGEVARKTLESVALATASYETRVNCGQYRVSMLNSSIMISDIGRNLAAHPEVDFAIVYFFTGSSVVFCMRSRDDAVNVGEIASVMGGGGQDHAASFSFPFSKGIQFLEKLRQGKVDFAKYASLKEEEQSA